MSKEYISPNISPEIKNNYRLKVTNVIKDFMLDYRLRNEPYYIHVEQLDEFIDKIRNDRNIQKGAEFIYHDSNYILNKEKVKKFANSFKLCKKNNKYFFILTNHKFNSTKINDFEIFS